MILFIYLFIIIIIWVITLSHGLANLRFHPRLEASVLLILCREG